MNYTNILSEQMPCLCSRA